MSRSQIHHSGGIRVDPTRTGRAALRRPSGALTRWHPPEGCLDELAEYMRQLPGRNLAILDGLDVLTDTPNLDGWASSLVLRVGEREVDGSYLISTQRSRYRVTRVG